MKPNHGSKRRPLVEYYYLKESFGLRGRGSNDRPSLRSSYTEMKREAAWSFVREAVLFVLITLVVIISFIFTAQALWAFLTAPGI